MSVPYHQLRKEKAGLKKKKYSFGGEKQGQEITVVTGEVFTWLTLRVFSRSLDLLSLTLRQRNSAR